MRLVQREPRTIVVAFARDADERDKTAADRRDGVALDARARFTDALNERPHRGLLLLMAPLMAP